MKLVILAVTKMHEGRICLAGINEDNRWIRPVKAYPNHLETGDIFNKKTNQVIYENFNIVDIPLIKKATETPHSEDYILDVNKDPKVIGTILPQERESFLIKCCENDFLKGCSEPINKLLEDSSCSLILVGPVKIHYVVLERGKTPRIHFEIVGVYKSDKTLPCTDLKFRALSKRILRDTNSQKIVLNSIQLAEMMGTSKIFLGIGLTRKYKEEFHTMIIGIYTIPDYEAKIDYGDV
jgi:hypothetical protein